MTRGKCRTQRIQLFKICSCFKQIAVNSAGFSHSQAAIHIFAWHTYSDSSKHCAHSVKLPSECMTSLPMCIARCVKLPGVQVLVAAAAVGLASPCQTQFGKPGHRHVLATYAASNCRYSVSKILLPAAYVFGIHSSHTRSHAERAGTWHKCYSWSIVPAHHLSDSMAIEAATSASAALQLWLGSLVQHNS